MDAFIFIHSSDEDAASNIKLIAQENSALGRNKRLYASVERDLGQQCYYWKGFGDAKGNYGYIFRKDRVVVFIGGPSLKAAKRFALHVANKI